MSDNHKSTLKTAWNDVTGDTIRTGKGSQEKYAEGWDTIFGKPQSEAIFKPKQKEEVTEIFTVQEVLNDPNHEAHEALKEILELVEKGELHAS